MNLCLCFASDRMTFFWSTMTKGRAETNWATPGRPSSGTEHRWEIRLSHIHSEPLPPPLPLLYPRFSMRTHTCSLPPFQSVGLATPAFSDRLALSRRHNRRRTARSACADKCLVSCHYVHLFFFFFFFYQLRQKTVYVTDANKWDEAEQSDPTCNFPCEMRDYTL